MNRTDKHKFWNSRAELGENAGTNDHLLKDLEMAVLRERIPTGSKVIDLGCGNGKTLVDLAESNNCSGMGIDFSEKMVISAQKRAKERGLDGSLCFESGSLEKLPDELGQFDYAVTERSLINLDGVDSQHEAFKSIMQLLRSGGKYLMIESFRQGLERVNELRRDFGLEDIDIPWHNAFLDEEEVRTWETDEYILEEIYPFSSSYYLLSRVVYAKLAADNGEELRYDSDINLLSCKLPPIGNFGPTRLWVWTKK